jgi:hypothetical protein
MFGDPSRKQPERPLRTQSRSLKQETAPELRDGVLLSVGGRPWGGSQSQPRPSP